MISTKSRVRLLHNWRQVAGMTTTVRAGAVGHLEEFDPKNDTMAAYIERATFYMEANNVAEDKKTATFLTTLGKNTFQVLQPSQR